MTLLPDFNLEVYLGKWEFAARSGRPEFRWGRLARWAEQHGGVHVLERRPMPPLGHFSLIRFGRSAAGMDGQGRPSADALPYAPERAG